MRNQNMQRIVMAVLALVMVVALVLPMVATIVSP